MRYSDRFYRDFSLSNRWKSFRVKVETSDLYIRARRDLSKKAEELILKFRHEIEERIKIQYSFLTSFEPVPNLNTDNQPLIIEMMYRASEIAGVGPMAAVAGAIAELVGKELSAESEEIIVENGGDIWLHVIEPVTISIYSGSLYFAESIPLKIYPEKTPCGICTSSGKIGHSFSYGKADAATIMASNAAVADAIATETCNRTKSEEDITDALSYAMSRGSLGAMVIFRDKLAIQGDIELSSF